VLVELARLNGVVELACLGVVVWSPVVTHFSTVAPCTGVQGPRILSQPPTRRPARRTRALHLRPRRAQVSPAPEQTARMIIFVTTNYNVLMILVRRVNGEVKSFTFLLILDDLTDSLLHTK
jgi:hypothetical protein